MRNISITTIVGLAFIGLAAEAGAGELMGDRAWTFNNQTSRASVASLMLQAENSQKGAAGYVGAGNACGGGGTATATANYTCIIMNNSNAAIEALQDNTGDQSSNAESDVSVTGTDSGSMGDVLESLTN